MNKKKCTIYGGVAVALAAATIAVPVFADDMTPAQLRAEADRLEMAQDRAEMTQAVVRDVLADANSNSLFL